MTKWHEMQALDALAASQFGVFSNDQAAELGVSRDMLLRHSGAGGPWRRAAPSVYEVVGLPADPRRALMAALLSTGSASVLCRRSAGLLLGLDGVQHRRPEILVPDGRGSRSFRVWRGSAPPDQIAITDGLRHTAVLRTFLDLCRCLDDVHLERALESILRHQLLTLAEIEALAAMPGWKGVVRLRRVVALRPPGAPPTGSEAETAFIQLVRPLVVEEPVRQYEVWWNGELIAVLDVGFPHARLFAEIDGESVHAQPAALYRDRSRQNDVVRVLGWLPLRYTAYDVFRNPVATTRNFLSAYGRARSIRPAS